MAYTVGCVAAATALALVVNVAFSFVPHTVPTVAAVVAFAFAMWWHIRGSGRFPGDKTSIQAVRTRAVYGRYGRLYFGMLLGFGVLTHMTTPAVYALLLAEAGLPRLTAISIGIGFGIGRSLPSMIGFAMGGRRGGPATAASWITRRTTVDRVVGATAAAVLVAVLVVAGIS